MQASDANRFPGSRRLRWRTRHVVLLIAVTLIAAATGWIIGRFRTARVQDEVDRLAISHEGSVFYDFECDELGGAAPSARHPPGPDWLREWLGLDFFSDIVMVGIHADPSDELLCRLGPLRQLRRLIVVNHTKRQGSTPDGRKVTVVDAVKSPITDDGLAGLRGLTEMRILELPMSQITDAGLVHLGRMSELRELDIGWATVTGAGLAHLSGLTQLEKLDLYCTPVADGDLQVLTQFPRLKRLNLNMTKITDAGLATLQGMRCIEDLRLVRTSISDAGLTHLMAMKQLRKLAVRQTKITERGLRQLEAALPGCEIEYYEPTRQAVPGEP